MCLCLCLRLYPCPCLCQCLSVCVGLLFTCVWVWVWVGGCALGWTLRRRNKPTPPPQGHAPDRTRSSCAALRAGQDQATLRSGPDKAGQDRAPGWTTRLCYAADGIEAPPQPQQHYGHHPPSIISRYRPSAAAIHPSATIHQLNLQAATDFTAPRPYIMRSVLSAAKKRCLCACLQAYLPPSVLYWRAVSRMPTLLRAHTYLSRIPAR